VHDFQNQGSREVENPADCKDQRDQCPEQKQGSQNQEEKARDPAGSVPNQYTSLVRFFQNGRTGKGPAGV